MWPSRSVENKGGEEASEEKKEVKIRKERQSMDSPTGSESPKWDETDQWLCNSPSPLGSSEPDEGKKRDFGERPFWLLPLCE